MIRYREYIIRVVVILVFAFMNKLNGVAMIKFVTLGFILTLLVDMVILGLKAIVRKIKNL